MNEEDCKPKEGGKGISKEKQNKNARTSSKQIARK